MSHAMSVLLVDDDPHSQAVFELVMRHFELPFNILGDAETALNYLQTNTPDVILMDINLPGISGIEAMKILHADSATAHIPIVALSANAIPRDIEKGLEAGFFRYLTKPIKVNEFTETLNVAFEFAESGVDRKGVRGSLPVVLAP